MLNNVVKDNDYAGQDIEGGDADNQQIIAI